MDNKQIKTRLTGLEPATNASTKRYSTTEL